jgi:hypothetical protein
MTFEPDENPYAAPCVDDAQSVIATSRSPTWPIMVVNSLFLLLNFAILTIGKSWLADLLTDLEIKLPPISFVAYSIVDYWLLSVFILLGFSFATTVAQSKLKRSHRGFASYFLLIVLSLWASFTFLFVLGVLRPLYHLITGLAR